MHNKVFEGGEICLHVQKIENIGTDKGDLNTKLFNDTSEINPTNILSQNNWDNWQLGGEISRTTDANCRPLSYDWITKHHGNTGDKLNIFMSLFHFDPKNGFDVSLQYIGTAIINLSMRQSNFGPLISEKVILENKLNADHSIINNDVICTVLYKAEILYAFSEEHSNDSIILPSLSPLKFQNNSMILNSKSNYNNNENHTVQSQPAEDRLQPRTPVPASPKSTINQTQRIESPKSPPLPQNALPISPQQQNTHIPSSPINQQTNSFTSPTSGTISPAIQSPQQQIHSPNIGAENNLAKLQMLLAENDHLNNLQQENQHLISELRSI